MPLAQLPEPFDHPDWIFELKLARTRAVLALVYDGFRALAYFSDGEVRLVSREGKRLQIFPGSFCESMAAFLKILEPACFDGEVVFLDDSGKPQFYDLMRRRTPQYFGAFDIVLLDGKDLRGGFR